MGFDDNWAERVGRVFDIRPRIGIGKDAVWLPRKDTTKAFGEAFTRPGAHVCLDGPSGVGKTSLARTYLFRNCIQHAEVQLVSETKWSDFCRLIIEGKKNDELSISGGVEIGIDKALPVAKFRVTLGQKNRPSEELEYTETLSKAMSEHDVARRLYELNVSLFIDDVERANDELLGRLSDLCKLLTQTYVAPNAKLIFVGSGDIYQRLYHKNPSLDERLLQVSLGGFKDVHQSWRFLTMGFDKLGLRHPGNSQFLRQTQSAPTCREAVWEAADGLPKSLNRLGQEIALKLFSRKGVSYTDIIDEARRLTEQHWREYGHHFPDVIKFLQKSEIGVSVLQCLYSEGIGRTHQFRDIQRYVEEHNGEHAVFTQDNIEEALNELAARDFLYRTGKSGEIVFAKHPTAAHSLGVVMRDPKRFAFLIDQAVAAQVEDAFPAQAQDLQMELIQEEDDPYEGF